MKRFKLFLFSLLVSSVLIIPLAYCTRDFSIKSVVVSVVYAAVLFFITRKRVDSLSLTAAIGGLILPPLIFYFVLFNYFLTWQGINSCFIVFALAHIVGVIGGVILCKLNRYLILMFAVFIVFCYAVSSISCTVVLQKANYGTYTGKQEIAINRNIPLISVRGDKSKLSSLKKGKLIVYIWSNYCGICINSLPDIAKMYEKFSSSSDISLVTINAINDTTEIPAAIEYCKEKGCGAPLYFIDSKILNEKLGITIFPVYLVVEDGFIRYWGGKELLPFYIH